MAELITYILIAIGAMAIGALVSLIAYAIEDMIKSVIGR